MLRKLLFAATITITLDIFLGVNPNSHSNFQPSKQNNPQTTLTTALEIQTEQPMSANDRDDRDWQ